MLKGIIILAVLVALLGLIMFFIWLRLKRMGAFDEDDKTSETDKITVSKDDDFQTILQKFNVPDVYYKIVIAQSHCYNVINCPAVLWKEDDIVKVLVLKRQPKLYEEEAEDFIFISSAPFVNFKQYDGTYYPDWAAASKEIKDIFLPYTEIGIALGGIDHKRQQYWAGTMCVYAKSLAEIFRMMGRPLSDYQMNVDNIPRMKTDGAIPAEMLAKREAEKKAAATAAEEKASQSKDKDMEAVWEAIRRLEEQKSGDEVSTEQINRLNAYLLAEKRYDDLERSTKDSDYQKTLLKEFTES